jgi:hypothetical protein
MFLLLRHRGVHVSFVDTPKEFKFHFPIHGGVRVSFFDRRYMEKLMFFLSIYDTWRSSCFVFQ